MNYALIGCGRIAVNVLKRGFAFITLIAVILSSLTACGQVKKSETGISASDDTDMWTPSAPVTAMVLTKEESSLYDTTVGVLLTQDLWTERDTYDAAHYLMVPMHYAFQSGNAQYIHAFGAFFDRFAEDITGEDSYGFLEYGLMTILQFYYFVTQFISLCAQYGYEDLVPVKLIPVITEKVSQFYYEVPGNWNCEPTRQEHFKQVLAGKEYPRSYYSSIDDFDLFFLSILCDLNVYHRVIGAEVTELEETAADLAYALMASPLLNEETERGGWIFQRGVWWDYPDYAYAGHQTITANMEPQPREDIVEDSSHSMRLASCVMSWRNAQPTHERYNLLEKRREQLATQFSEVVCKKVDGYWLASTFMDGTCGVYRYSYNTEGVGYSGYENSAHILIGWWSLLEDARIQKIYAETLNLFPLGESRDSNPYFDFATVRDQNPYFDADTGYELGMYECMVLCAAKLNAGMNTQNLTENNQ